MKFIRLRRFVLSAAAIALLAASGCAVLEVKQRELIFRPNKETYRTPADYGLAYEDLRLDVRRSNEDVERIHGWWIPSDETNAPALLYLHGSRWNIGHNLVRIAQLQRMGFSILAVDYRGFGQSDGDLPSEEQVYVDARVAWEELKRRVPEAHKRLIYGHSLGGAIAIDLAVNGAGAAGVIAESTFTSIRDMVEQSSYWFLPVHMVLTQHFDTLAKVERLRIPVLFIHGTGDRRVPHRMGERLYAAAPEPKKLLLVQNAGHSNSLWVAPEQYSLALREFTAFARHALAGLAPVW